MNILVTGCAGFIGYSLTHKIIINKNFTFKKYSDFYSSVDKTINWFQK